MDGGETRQPSPHPLTPKPNRTAIRFMKTTFRQLYAAALKLGEIGEIPEAELGYIELVLIPALTAVTQVNLEIRDASKTVQCGIPGIQPCPFCGGEAEAIIGPVANKWGVECLKCDAWRDDRKDTKEAAITAWNHRDPWRPIETAPKDGKPILLCVAGYVPAVGKWEEFPKPFLFAPQAQWRIRDRSEFATDEDWRASWIEGGFKPTHWMSIPPSPQP